jgi:hypothetical protein
MYRTKEINKYSFFLSYSSYLQDADLSRVRHRIQNKITGKYSVADPACHCDTDPDPACHFDADADPDPTFHFHTQCPSIQDDRKPHFHNFFPSYLP